MTAFYGLLLAGLLVWGGLEAARLMARQKAELSGRLRDAELRLSALDEAKTRLESRVEHLEELVARSGRTEGGE